VLFRSIFALSPGNISKIVNSRYGFHIFLVEEKISAHQQKFPEAREQIREKLLLNRERDQINKELSSLFQRIDVEIYRDKLDFHYIESGYHKGIKQ
jgi:parvulin-like peptidyl-prolyl isomerase